MTRREAPTDLRARFLVGRSSHTSDAYARDLDNFDTYLVGCGAVGKEASQRLEWFFGQPAGRANELVLHYQHALFARSLSPGTVSRRIACVRSIVKYARMLGAVPWTIEIKLPRRELSRDTAGPTVAVVQTMMRLAAGQAAPVGPRDVALLRLAYDLALRISELARLDLADVDLVQSAVWILGKGRRAKERLALPPATVSAVRAWLAVRGLEKGPLLCSFSRANPRGRLSRGGVYRVIRDLGAQAGTQVRPHGLRHTAITQAIDLAAAHGLSIDVVRQFSRHKNIATLLVYRDQHENAQPEFARWVSESVPT